MSKFASIKAEDRAAYDRLATFVNKGKFEIQLTAPMVELLQVIIEGPRGRTKEQLRALFNNQQLSALYRRGCIEPKADGSYRHTEISLHIMAVAEVAGLVRPTKAPVMQLPVKKKQG